MNVQFSALNLDAKTDLLAVGVNADQLDTLDTLDALNDRFGGHLLSWITDNAFKAKAGQTLLLPVLGQIGAKALLLVGVGDETQANLWKAATTIGNQARTLKAESLTVSLSGQVPSHLRAIIAGNYHYQTYFEEDRCTPALSSVQFCSDEVDLSLAQVEAKHQSWARDLVNLPPADLNPDDLVKEALKLADLPNVSVEIWDMARCKSEGCVGIVAVGQGSACPGSLIHISYRPDNAKAHVGLIGKGVTFDSGGLSLKPSAGMIAMKCDMGGAATVLGATAIIAESAVPVAVDCFIGTVENMTGGNSYKLGDVLRYSNGVTVEIHNTDAEGRLVLADALIQAAKVDGITEMIDVATLTGACAMATGPDFTGLFTPDDALASDLQTHAAQYNEGLWRLPYHLPYKSMLKSQVASIKNVGKREGGATTAALFLGHFVGDKRWAHLDIAGSAFMDSAHEHYQAGATGEMVCTLAAWVRAKA